MIVIIISAALVLVSAYLLFRPRPMTPDRAEQIACDWWTQNGAPGRVIGCDVLPTRWEGCYEAYMWVDAPLWEAHLHTKKVLVEANGHVEALEQAVKG